MCVFDMAKQHQTTAGPAAHPTPGKFPPRMPLGQFLFAYLHRRGVRHSFGVPGDFALPTFAWLDKSPIQSITMTHEPGAGFAADAYSRLNGIGLVCVTYCVGGLNVLNAIAGAYAEKSPVVVVSGAPGREDRKKDPLLHHKVRTFETQRLVYNEVTVASTVSCEEDRAAAEIVRCVEACLRHKRPVYIEVPYDMVDREIPTVQEPPRPERIRPPGPGRRLGRNHRPAWPGAKTGHYRRRGIAPLRLDQPGRAICPGRQHPHRRRSAFQKRAARKIIPSILASMAGP